MLKTNEFQHVKHAWKRKPKAQRNMENDENGCENENEDGNEKENDDEKEKR